MNKTKFFRVEKTKNYSVINNEFLRRPDMSAKAKGILAYILHLPDTWNINLNEIQRHFSDGEKSFRTGWNELKEKGYVERRPIREGQRIVRWETIVRESVDIKGDSLLADFVQVENVQVENVQVQNGNLLNTNSINYLNELSTKESKPARHKYGEYKNVLLSDDDYQKLKEEYPNHFEKYIEDLSSYMASTGKSYKSHLVTIRNWARKDGIQKGQELIVEARAIDPNQHAGTQEFLAQWGVMKEC